MRQGLSPGLAASGDSGRLQGTWVREGTLRSPRLGRAPSFPGAWSGQMERKSASFSGSASGPRGGEVSGQHPPLWGPDPAGCLAFASARRRPCGPHPTDSKSPPKPSGPGLSVLEKGQPLTGAGRPQPGWACATQGHRGRGSDARCPDADHVPTRPHRATPVDFRLSLFSSRPGETLGDLGSGGP